MRRTSRRTWRRRRLAAYALVKSGRHVDLTNKAITYLIRSKDSYGTWQTTQATVWALKTLLLTLTKAGQEVQRDGAGGGERASRPAPSASPPRTTKSCARWMRSSSSKRARTT